MSHTHTHTHLLGALAAFDLLISDELIPDGMNTYHLATKASLFYSLEALKKKEDIETGMENEQSVEGAESSGIGIGQDTRVLGEVSSA